MVCRPKIKSLQTISGSPIAAAAIGRNDFTASDARCGSSPSKSIVRRAIAIKARRKRSTANRKTTVVAVLANQAGGVRRAEKSIGQDVGDVSTVLDFALGFEGLPFTVARISS